MKEWVREQLPGAELEVRVGCKIFDVKYNDRVFECQASQISVAECNAREECALDNKLLLTWLLAVPFYGKTIRRDGKEYAKLKAVELQIIENCGEEPLLYLEWHPARERMVSFSRITGAPRISEANEWRDWDEECKTIFEIDSEESNINLAELVLS